MCFIEKDDRLKVKGAIGVNRREQKCFALRLRQLRQMEGKTQALLAESLGISRSCLANLEACNREPSKAIEEKICRYFAVRKSFLHGCESADTKSIIHRLDAYQNDVLDLSEMEKGKQDAVRMLHRFLLQKQGI